MCAAAIRCGLVVRIPGFHPGGPGSIPGTGTFFLYTYSTYFSVVVKTNTNNYAERWCTYIKAEYTSERKKEKKYIYHI